MKAAEKKQSIEMLLYLIEQLDICFVMACKRKDYKEMTAILKDVEKLKTELKKYQELS